MPPPDSPTAGTDGRVPASREERSGSRTHGRSRSLQNSSRREPLRKARNCSTERFLRGPVEVAGRLSNPAFLEALGAGRRVSRPLRDQ